MSYCVECGVELAEYHKKCPLCETPVHNPNRSFDFSKNDYPVFKMHRSVLNRRKVVRQLVGFILTMCFLMAALIPAIVDLKINSTITWSVYPILSMSLLWISIAVPFFKKRNTFFREFTLAWTSTAVFVVLVNLVSSGQFSWARYAIASMVFVWILLSGIFVPKRIRKFVPVLLVYILTAVGYFILIASWIADVSAIFSLVLPLEGIILIVFLVSFFIVRSNLHGILNYMILFLSDILFVSVGFDLVISRFFNGSYAFTWSFIVAITIVPLIIAALIIRKRVNLHGVLSRKLHS